MLLNLDQLTISLDIPNDESNSNSHNSPCSFKDLDDWDIWVKSEYIILTSFQKLQIDQKRTIHRG